MARHVDRAIAWIVAFVLVVGPAHAGHHFLYVTSGLSRTLYAQQEEPGSPRAPAPLTILQINDVYSTLPVDELGGLARVATLKQQLAAAGRTPFLIFAGDFLSPSVASSTFKGEQMIAALNAAGLDLATLGNHEFDFGDDLLIQRMREAKWQWVVSNVIDTKTGKPIADAAPYVVKMFGPLNVGFIGLCLNTSEISEAKLTHTRLVDPLEAAAQYLPILKREGATVIVRKTYSLTTPDFILKGGDGYTMFAGQRVLIQPESGDLLVSALENYVASKKEIAPEIDGRILILR